MSGRASERRSSRLQNDWRLVRDFAQRAFLLAQMGQGSESRERLDTPHPRRNTRLGEDLQQPDVAGRLGVGEMNWIVCPGEWREYVGWNLNVVACLGE